MSKMKKGISPFSVAFFSLFALLILTSSFFILFLTRSNVSVRTDRESRILQAINSVELTKRTLLDSLFYSAYESSYLVGVANGVLEPSMVKTYDCLPFYSEDPKNKENLEENTLKFLNEYVTSFSSEVSIPEFTGVYFVKLDDKVMVSARSDGKLLLERESVEIEDEVVFNVNVRLC